MTIELGLLFAAIACIIGVAGFFGGRTASAKKDGEHWGKFEAELKTDITYIKRDVGEIKMSVNDSSKVTMAAIEKERADRKESIQKIHEEFEKHLRLYHGVQC